MGISSHINSRWLMVISDKDGKKLSLIAKDARDCTLPGHDLEGSRINGGGGSVFMDLMPDRISFRPVQFNFQVDEMLENYVAALQIAYAFISGKDPYFDASVVALDTLGDPTGVEFIFTSCRISSMGDMDYDNVASNKNLTCNITLKYENLKVKVNGIVVLDISENINE